MKISYREHDGLSVIYKITNKANGKIYVGSTSNLWVRFKRYVRASKGKTREDGMAINFALEKYGIDNFEFEILERVNDTALLKDREQHWLNTLRPFVPNGYNIAKNAVSVLGHKYPAEQQRLINEKRGYGVYQIDKQTLKIIGEFTSADEATRAVSPNKSRRGGVSDACRGRTTSAYGYYWCYKSDYAVKGFSPKPHGSKVNGGSFHNIKPVYQLKEFDNVVKTWESVSQVHQETGYDESTIHKVCKGEFKQAHGYRWRYVEDPILIAEIQQTRKQRLGIT